MLGVKEDAMEVKVAEVTQEMVSPETAENK